MRKRTPSGASTEKPLPRPGTTSTVRWVCFQYSYWVTDIQNGMVRSRPATSRSPRRMSASEVMKSPSGKHMGDDPSQQPPDWWNINGPCLPVRVRSRSAAVSVRSTRCGSLTRYRLPGSGQAGPHPYRYGCGPAPSLLCPFPGSEEPELLRGVAHQQVLRLLVVVKHHLVVLTSDTGLLIAAEGGVRGISVIAVRPDPAGLDFPAGP